MHASSIFILPVLTAKITIILLAKNIWIIAFGCFTQVILPDQYGTIVSFLFCFDFFFVLFRFTMRQIQNSNSVHHFAIQSTLLLSISVLSLSPRCHPRNIYTVEDDNDNNSVVISLISQLDYEYLCFSAYFAMALRSCCWLSLIVVELLVQ